MDVLSTSGINNLVNTYRSNELSKSITPLESRKKKYQDLSSSYNNLLTKLESLKTVLTSLKLTGTDSVFNTMTAATSAGSFISASAAAGASAGLYNIRIAQLARNDIAVSHDSDAAAAAGISGIHTFTIKTGDGEGGEYLSNIEVTLSGTETKKELAEKIAEAVNSDKAVITGSVKAGSLSFSGGPGELKISINGTETSISFNGGGTYSELIDEIVTKINSQVTGVTAEKIQDSPGPGDVRLKLTVNKSSDNISISHGSGYDLANDLNISVQKEKGASGIISASSFSPVTGKSQLSFTSLMSGLDYRITGLSDSDGSSALNQLGLNLGTSRPAFNQDTDPDTAGFLYADITSGTNLLNSKFTLNGISVQRNSNSVSDLVNGITFTLNSAMTAEDKDAAVTVSKDISSVRKKIEDFITRFNDVYSYIKTNSLSSSAGRGIFRSDSNAISILNTLTSLAYKEINGLPDDNLDTLYEIGIKFDPAAGLVISDGSKLDTKLKEVPEQVEAIFNSAEGIAVTLYDKVNPYLGAEGYLSGSKENFNNNVTALNDRIASANKRIDKSAELLRKRYEQLQAQYAALLTTQSYFSSIFNLQ